MPTVLRQRASHVQITSVQPSESPHFTGWGCVLSERPSLPAPSLIQLVFLEKPAPPPCHLGPDYSSITVDNSHPTAKKTLRSSFGANPTTKLRKLKSRGVSRSGNGMGREKRNSWGDVLQAQNRAAEHMRQISIC